MAGWSSTDVTPQSMLPDPPCEDPNSCGGSTYIPVGYEMARNESYADCRSAAGAGDSDRDGVRDACEFELATLFRPRLALSSTDCNTNREPYWAVQSGDATARIIRIFYAVAYHRDCGSPRPDCPFACASHEGDSEFIILEIAELNRSWTLQRATLSAHWRTDVDATSTQQARDFQFASWDRYLGRPIIWVAEDKHANYRSRSKCDAGAYYYDNCDRNAHTGSETLDIVVSRNLGRASVPLLTLIPSSSGMPGVEHFWSSLPFHGWHAPRTGAGSSSYYFALDWYHFT